MSRSSFVGTVTSAPTLVGDKVKLRPKMIKDAADDYRWHTDAELCRLDAAIAIPVSLEEYIKSYVAELSYPRKGCCLAIETLDGKHIGNCSYLSIDDNKKEVELGIMIGDKAYWNQGYGADVIQTMLNYIFSETSLQRVCLKTLDWNERAQRCFKKCGFVPCGELIHGDYKFIIMEIRRPPRLPK